MISTSDRDRFNCRRDDRDMAVAMTKYGVQDLRSLRDEMKAVVRGERPAPAHAAEMSFNSVDAVSTGALHLLLCKQGDM
jgi:hypothetical protein